MKIPPNSRLAQILKARAAKLTNTDEPTNPQPTQPAAESIAPTTRVAEIPSRLRRLEPAEPVEVANDDPVFDAVDAATILGIKSSRLLKWKERDQGPDYLWYDDDYPRYELSALIEFRAAHRIRPSRQPHPGKKGQ
jgi:hypothetical protein